MSAGWKRAVTNLWREARRVLTPAHLVALAAALLLGIEGVARSMGVSMGAMVTWGGQVGPLVMVMHTPYAVLMDARHGSLELIGATRTGLASVQRLRLTALFGWYGLLQLALYAPSVFAQGSSYLLDWASLLVDGLFFMAIALLTAQRSGSEAAGALVGISVWALSLIVGKSPPSALPWLGRLVPFSSLLWGAWPIILGNRLLYLCAALGLLTFGLRKMDSIERFGPPT